MRRQLFFVLATVVIGTISVFVQSVQGFEPAKFNPERGYTMFSVPKAAKAPIADGKIDPGEWDGAFLINAMSNQQQRPRFSFLYARWVKWRLMWDENHLYLCGESQRLPNENLITSHRDKISGGRTIFDDSIEVHFTPVGRNAVDKKLPWSGQAILNSFGVAYYSKFTWSVAARSTLWQPDWQIGSQLYQDRWIIEIIVPRESLDLSQPLRAGEAWAFLLARNWKVTGWNQSVIPFSGDSFLQPRTHPFGYLTDGAYCQLEDLSGLFKGDIHTELKLGTCGTKSEKVKIKLLVEELSVKDKKPGREKLKWEMEAEIRVTPGKFIDWKVDKKKKLPGGRYRYFLEVTSTGSTHPLLKLNFLFRPGGDAALKRKAAKLVAKPYSYNVQLAQTQNVLGVFCDFLYAPNPEAVNSMQITLSGHQKDSTIFSGDSENSLQMAIRSDFKLPVLAPGKYDWKITLLDRSGKPIHTGQGSIEKKDPKEFAWYDFKGGDIDKILRPYSAIEVYNGGAHLKYWGGSVYLTGLGLPRQLSITANHQWRPQRLEQRPSLLSREVEIQAVQNGKAARVQFQAIPRTSDVKEHKVSMRGYGLIGTTVEIQSDAIFHQDGLLWITMTLRPSIDSSSGRDQRRKEGVIERLTIDIPFQTKVARSLVAHGEPGYGSFAIGALPEGEGVVWNCTDVAKSVMLYGNLLPMVWIGSDQRGLCFFAENNKGWVHKDLPDQQIIRADGEVLLRLNIIQDRLVIKQDHTFSFGFMPTPMRKMTSGWRMLNTYGQSFGKIYIKYGRNLPGGAKNASYMPASYDKSRNHLFKNSHQRLRPGQWEFAPHTERAFYESRSIDRKAKKIFGLEWAQNTWTKEFQDHLLYHTNKWIEKGGLTGWYRDQFYPYAVNNYIAGAAWKLPDGRVNKGYNLRLDRTFCMREYALFQEKGIKPRIFCHATNSGQIIAYPWVSSLMDGETNRVIANAKYDHADLYPPKRMQAFGNPWPWGNTFVWMRSIDKQPGTPWQKRQDRAYMGWAYLHDVFNHGLWQIEQSHRPQLFKWGMNDSRVKYWPYWRIKDLIYSSNKNVLISMWTLPDRALLCIFNYHKKERISSLTIRIPIVDLGLMPEVRSGYVVAHDLLTSAAVGFDAWNGALTLKKLQPHDFRMLVIRRY